MALWKLTKRVIIPVGAVVSVPFVVPLIFNEGTNESKMVKPVDLPVYDDAYQAESPVKDDYADSTLLESISKVRKSIFSGFTVFMEQKEKAVEYFEIGKAHTENAYNYLLAEENVVPRAAAITFGGLFGLLMSARKGIFKKMMYTSTGIIGVSFLCYPQQATQVSQDVYKIGKYYAWMAYNKYQESGGKGSD